MIDLAEFDLAGFVPSHLVRCDECGKRLPTVPYMMLPEPACRCESDDLPDEAYDPNDFKENY